MSLAAPWGLAALALAVPVIVLHILRPRRQAIEVSSTYLWRGVERPVSSAVPWQKLRASWLLAAQLLALVAGSLALANPVRVTPARLAEHTVMIFDTSASMGATDGAPDRLSSAKQRAEHLRDELPPGGRASIVVAGARPRVVLSASDDRQAFSDALGLVQLSEGRADFAGAFALAQSLETSTAPIGFVLFSDGGLSEEEQRLQPPGTIYERIGSRDVNRALSAMTVVQRGSGLHVEVTAKNTGGPAALQDLSVDVDGVTAASERVELKPGVAVTTGFDVPLGDRIEAFLAGGDLLAADDRAVAVAARRPDLDVLVVGDTLFVAELLAAIPGVTTTVADDPGATGAGYDVVVYSGTTVPADVAVPYLAIAPPGGAPGVDVAGMLDAPAVTTLHSDSPLIAGLDLTGIAIAAAQRVDAPLADELVGAVGGPLLLSGTTTSATGRSLRYVYLGFALAESNLPVQVVFPILGDRVVTTLAGTGFPASASTVGDPLPVDPGADATIVAPDGRERDLASGSAVPTADRAGFWGVRTGDGPLRLVAVNPPPGESAIAPQTGLLDPPTRAGTAAEAARGRHSLVGWVIAVFLAVVVVEALLARRSVGVGRAQWRWALVARAAVAALLLGALAAPVVRRPANRVATVFVIDASASLGQRGHAAATEWVRQALSHRRGDDLAAVVAFGGDARLDRLLEPTSAFDGTRVVVDDSATNIQAALRLADAVLPADARRRVVLVSDGRPTSGDSIAEAEELARSGTPVDVHLVEDTPGRDAALGEVDAPTLARTGEEIRITAVVEANTAGPAAVALRLDGVEVARRTVDLVAGDNPVAFTDVPAAAPGVVMRYQVTVEQGGDTRRENDSGFVAVPVDGPAKVLVVEGSRAEAATLTAALNAGGVLTETVSGDGLPTAQQLVTYSSVVLVDVDARELGGEQLATLTTAVRDLGRGLVTVGGERSYGVGGYRSSPLEELLPVISEVLDPKRRKTVAEVLSIDVSGSMANCHCSEGQVAVDRLGGGVNKTDISRAAAARTVEALSASDEVGIVAWNQSAQWIVDLQQLPPDEVVEDGLRRLVPAGATNFGDSLGGAAEALRASKAALKHIIVFSDGFTDPAIIETVAEQAASLYQIDGITTSVIATGEGAAPSLEDIAVQGHGRYYPGRDLAQVPQVIAEEAVIASRDFITEGEFLPEVTAATAVTDHLSAAPPLLGYVATTAKGSATTALRIGPDRDPLLASWQAGLGKVTSWTSDASAGWSQHWAGWDGYVGFWSDVVKDTFPAGDTAGAVRAAVVGGRLHIELDAGVDLPDGATASAVVAGPDGQRTEVPLEPTNTGTLSADLPASRPGSYAVGVTVNAGGETVLSSTGLASESYPQEYRPGNADRALLERISAITGGRGETTPESAFSASGLAPGTRLIPLRFAFLLAAVLAWPVAVLLSRLSLRGATVGGALAAARSPGRRLRAVLPSVLPQDPGEGRAPQRGEPGAACAPSSVEELLARKRTRRGDPDRRDPPA